MDTADAHYQLLLADRIAADADRPGRTAVQIQLDRTDADQLRQSALQHLRLDETPERVAGNELTTRGQLRSPEALKVGKVTTKASVERLNFVANIGALDLALDTAESVGAETALEKMLAHGVAAAHKTAMDVLEQAARRSDPHEQVKLMNAAARLLTVVQTGALTIQRIKTGGAQTITVRQVHIADGGQAVIGNVSTGGCARNIGGSVKENE